ncbi:adenylate/guanylate cyclase domain-containing protein [Phenylobacterium sp. J367]|uniref:adenylate/guanylate cyclase domain-containing protein n=1 Tax=Phenylobacterium sp. J367 TaxID=2898435 RepID=UPI002151CDD9|nr:adenylate/guanylate cyclase domain-containing protein [Phenylobacterium sp. J367]MCR5878531.1 adenylate/guanylate cyclase domain-containing protein [Phenylobacterium sp. J367]
MSSRKVERRLAAILAADVAGYSRLVAADEEGVLRRFATHLHDVIEPAVSEHGGRIFKTLGDGLLVEFASAVGALRCALAIQAGVGESNRPVPEVERLEFRIGIHTADVVIEEGDIFGDGVNVAARLEAIAEPGGICVSARVQEDAQGRLDAEFDDLGEQPLKNIPRPVRAYRVRLGEPGGAAGEAARAAALPLPAKPSIAVLPFHNMSGDPEQEYFADAITEDIVTALSRWRWFFVIARDSSFAFKGRAGDPGRVGQELGVRYVLEGSVRRAGQRVRVTALLVEAATGAHIWADTFDREMVDIFALQDEITEQVVGAIEPAMLHSEGMRVSRKSPHDLTAVDCFQRGMWHLNKMSAEGFRAARDLFRQALELDPDLALAHIGLARSLYGAAIYGWSDQPKADIIDAYASALNAIRCDPRDAYGYFAASGAALYLGRHREALEAARKAIVLNPNFAFGHFRLGQVLTYSGRAKEAIAPIERSLRYSPFDPQLGPMHRMLALANFHAGDFAEAAAQAEAAIRLNDLAASALLAASLARLGRLEEAARAYPQELRARMRARVVHPQPYANAADRDALMSAVRLATEAGEYVR